MRYPYKFSLIFIVIAILYYVLSFLLDIDAFEFIAYNLSLLEKYEIDEILICSFIITGGVLIDCRRKFCYLKIEGEKAGLFNEIMNAVLNIFFNFLQNAYYFNQYAKKNKLMDDEELDRFDKVIFENKEKIKRLNEIENVSVEEIREVVKVIKEEFSQKEKNN